MDNNIEVGSLVYCYRREKYVGGCYGLKTVAEITVEGSETLYRITPATDDMPDVFPASCIVLAPPPPAGTTTKFRKGDRVHCFGTYNVHFAMAVIDNITWFEGQPEYHVTPTQTPWCPMHEDALQLAGELTAPSPEWDGLIF